MSMDRETAIRLFAAPAPVIIEEIPSEVPERQTPPEPARSADAIATPIPLSLPPARRAPDSRLATDLAGAAVTGGRKSRDNPNSTPRVKRLLAPSDPESYWRVEDLDRETMKALHPADILQLLTDISPEVSLGLWNFLRFANPGWECKVYRPGTREPHPEGQALTDDFWRRLSARHGATDVPLNRLFTADFLRGAKAMELVLDLSARTMLDLATPDPFTLRFEERPDPTYGTTTVPFQYASGSRTNKVYLDIPTFKYIPIDPFPNSPYGRPLVTPALFPTLFTISLMHDLKRVIAVQGYPRIHVTIDTEKVQAASDANMTSDEYMDFLDDIVAQVKKTIDELEPDQTYVSSDLVKMERPIGTLDTNSLGTVDGILRALERMTIRALKSMPILMGANEATTEVGANRQWEAWSAGIRAMQHGGEQGLGELLATGLRAGGVQASPEFRFQELRQSEELRDAQALQVKLNNAWTAYAFGFVSLDQAGIMALNHLPDPEAGGEPRYLPAGFAVPMAPDTQNIPAADPTATSGRAWLPMHIAKRFLEMPNHQTAPEWFAAWAAETDERLMRAQSDSAPLTAAVTAIAALAGREAPVPPAPEVRVEVHPAPAPVVNVTLPEMTSPDVRVEAPNVETIIEAAPPTPPARITRRVVRDERGLIERIIEEPEEGA